MKEGVNVYLIILILIVFAVAGYFVYLSMVSPEPEKGVCSSDAHCVSQFSTCGCDYVCRVKGETAIIDCAKACDMFEINNTKPVCGCVENKCLPL